MDSKEVVVPRYSNKGYKGPQGSIGIPKKRDEYGPSKSLGLLTREW